MVKSPASPKKPKTAAHFVHEWRKERKLTQEQLAELIGATSGAISQLENGLINYTQPTLEALAKALRCRPADLLAGPPSEGAEPDAKLRSALLAYGVDGKDMGRVVGIVKTFLKPDEGQPEQSPARDLSQPANRRRESEPSP